MKLGGSAAAPRRKACLSDSVLSEKEAMPSNAGGVASKYIRNGAERQAFPRWCCGRAAAPYLGLISVVTFLWRSRHVFDSRVLDLRKILWLNEDVR